MHLPVHIHDPHCTNACALSQNLVTYHHRHTRAVCRVSRTCACAGGDCEDFGWVWVVWVVGACGGDHGWCGVRREAAGGVCLASQTHEQCRSPAAAQSGRQLGAQISNVMIHYSCAHQTQTQLPGVLCDHTHEVWWSNSQRLARWDGRRVCRASRGAP